MKRTIVILTGQEGTGKTTLAKKLLPHMPNSAAFDAENVLQVNPFFFDREFRLLAVKNTVSLIGNFFEAGFRTVLAGSFLGDIEDYDEFRRRLEHRADIYIIMLKATKPVRDRRRIAREKPSTKRFRDWLDRKYPGDTTLKDAQRDYRYVELDNSRLSIRRTIEQIKEAIPGVFD